MCEALSRVCCTHAAAARLLFDLKPRDHVTPVLRELHWLPVVPRVEYKLCLLVHKALFGQAPDYITKLLTPTFHHALHCAPTTTAKSSNQEPNGELVTVHSLSPHLVYGIAYRQNWNSWSSTATFKRHLKSFLFRMAYDVMHLRADCRRRTTNSAVTVTAGLHEFHSTAQHERYATCSEHFLLNNSYCRCCGPATGVNNELATWCYNSMWRCR